ncbi:tripartite motif containing 22 [Phyllostomus discolor]|uniref:E3 ubiquitin-protein ligase TRIM22-like isoform X4 n=1 Tax=Phyllostomus discolor TaxID=89673 RepID=A0A7E6E4Z3_9CHIR|nr:E3 ubiquitin-protein ligase TRIM22-like isoform X4 [Phyllostomus discolor]XP_035886068.1 E3 ubiquitin-protein ligase TRIM22-like isoform X4 [Phyllostomus discolor]XP_035886070.1 E3 ubiquitin-protein ligase TRIM22-like isoform X4 [Phyllostomus discolor]XP_035886071.1 E3 ubiquitin-protein ligase TRIM22-like isoform X4 [Phyllostomus discolor]XP_035886072.1 E3 ubiquitin-protein ligase TRIM22-like isoform X4 [Phyllostomus discolor]XP_035886073.1 E3 ubiquitin-protein ligase TRIM22-like isoform X4
MDFSSQESINAVTCPICQELLTEPMSLDCGHSFCQACITAESESGSPLGLECCCPVCQSRYQPWNLQFNWQLAERVNKFRGVDLNSHKPRRRDLCEHHGENYDIFCKDDEKAICRLCVQEHQGHQMSPIVEVVKEYQEKLQEALKKLSQEQQEAEQLEADINEERITWVKLIQTERERILQGFEQMRGILDKEEQRELQKLEEDEVNVNELTSDLQPHMPESVEAIDMPQDVINVLRRTEIDTLNKPKIVSNKAKSAFRFSDLTGMLQMFKELTEVQSYWVDLMLNPLDAVSNVVISADQRQVTVGQHSMSSNVYPCNPCNFSAFDVVGNQHFSSGKYYWEVDVSGKIAWILGVYSTASNLNRKKSSGFVFNPNVNDSNAYSRFRPENGFWVIGLQNESEYTAFEDSPTSDPKVLTLYMAVPPHRVGVFLDYEAGTVSFFNVTNQGSLIYKFSKCQFSQTAYPYFNPWNCPVPMTLCPPGS